MPLTDERPPKNEGEMGSEEILPFECVMKSRSLDPSYMSLALDMLEVSENPENCSRWLLEYCMRRNEENRISRESGSEKKGHADTRS
ncbi:hypothetical protein TWF788_000132 [Orbilia oligospora]|uniref:Uncharacterized protein n=1 Tax=Orbilia oligospora TaxID=2813651 RepID=A0A7C8U2F7_ORBOL|nr:hypothetical protein TWF788_000132 [Orbilia oligospora]